MENVFLENVRFSAFAERAHRDGVIALFNKLHPEPVFIAKPLDCTLEKLFDDLNWLNGKGKLKQELADCQLLIASESEDHVALATSQEATIERITYPSILYLMLTTDCNISCSFCPISYQNSLTQKKYLSVEQAVSGVKLWQANLASFAPNINQHTIIFYGGEPLLNRSVLESLLPFLDNERKAGRLPSNLDYMLCTNGILINRSLCRLLADYQVVVALGLDSWQWQRGLPVSNNIISRNFTALERTIDSLINARLSVVASLTLVPDRLDELVSAPTVLRNLGVSKLGFNLMKGRGLVDILAGQSLDLYHRRAAAVVLQGWEYFSRCRHFFEYQLEKKYVALHQGLPFAIDCTCYGNQIVIHPNAIVGNCPFVATDRSSVSLLSPNFRLSNSEIVALWQKRLPILKKSVWERKGFLDGGGCAWGASQIYGDIMANDAGNTVYNQEVMNELIWKLLPFSAQESIVRGETDFWSYRWHRDRINS